MRLALSVAFGQDDQLIIAQQLGVEQVLVAVDRWDLETLSSARNRVEQTGLELAGLEGLPPPAGGAAPFAAIRQALDWAGQAGIPLVVYRWPLAKVVRPEQVLVGRGEALVQSSRPAGLPEEQWGSWARFLEQVLPAAEKVGVKLAGAVLLQNPADLDRLLGLHASPCHGVDLDLETLADPVPAIRRLVPQGRVLAVRVGNTGPGRQQSFLDEGEVDLPAAVLALRRAGYAGLLRAAPPPGMVGDTEWGHKGRAFDLGYLRALLQAVGRV